MLHEFVTDFIGVELSVLEGTRKASDIC